jgi:hypothetical protein
MSPEIIDGIEFFLYKIACLGVGLDFCYMGYRLFLAGIEKSDTDVEISRDKWVIKLAKAAPGTCFSIFGAIIVCFAVLKGYDTTGFFTNALMCIRGAGYKIDGTYDAWKDERYVRGCMRSFLKVVEVVKPHGIVFFGKPAFDFAKRVSDCLRNEWGSYASLSSVYSAGKPIVSNVSLGSVKEVFCCVCAHWARSPGVLCKKGTAMSIEATDELWISIGERLRFLSRSSSVA